MIQWILLRNDTLHIYLNIGFNIQTKHLFNYNVFIHLNVNGRGMSFKDTKQVIYGGFGLNHNDVNIDIN